MKGCEGGKLRKDKVGECGKRFSAQCHVLYSDDVNPVLGSFPEGDQPALGLFPCQNFRALFLKTSRH